MRYDELWPFLVGQDANVHIPRPMIAITGSLEAAAVLADLVWWQANHGDGFWRTDAQIVQRQGVTAYAVGKARRDFVARGWIETMFSGIPPKLHYCVDIDAIGQALASSLGERGDNSPDSQSQLRVFEELSINLKEEERGVPTPKPKALPVHLTSPDVWAALCDWMRVSANPSDLSIQTAANMRRLAEKYVKAGEGAAEVDADAATWRADDWRGKQGGAPTASQAKDHRAKRLAVHVYAATTNDDWKH